MCLPACLFIAVPECNQHHCCPHLLLHDLLHSYSNSFEFLQSKDLFGLVGPVQAARIIYDDLDRSSGTAYVTFASSEHAQSAVDKYNGKAIDGDSGMWRTSMIRVHISLFR